jgi:ankyrin repeat protein
MKETKDKMRNFNRLLTAIMGDNLSRFKEYIHQCDPKDLQYTNDKGENLLFYAMHYSKSSNRITMLKELFKYDININQRNKNNQTILLKSAQESYVDFSLVKLLLDNGANINAKNKDAENFVLYVFSKPLNLRRHKDELLWLVEPQYNLDMKATNNKEKSLIHFILDCRTDETFVFNILEKIKNNHSINFIPSKAEPIIKTIITQHSFKVLELFQTTELWNQDNLEYFVNYVQKNNYLHDIKRLPSYQIIEKQLISFEKDKLDATLVNSSLTEKNEDKPKKLKL